MSRLTATLGVVVSNTPQPESAKLGRSTGWVADYDANSSGFRRRR